MLFNQRHQEIEKDRAELIARLSALKEPSRKHPGYNRAIRLLNKTRRPEGGHLVDQYC